MWVWSDYFLNLNKKWKLHFQLDESNPQAADRQGEDGEIVEAFSRCFYVTSSAMYLSTHGQACRRPRPNNAILFPLNDCLSQSANVTRSFSQFAKSWKKREGYTSMLKKKKKMDPCLYLRYYAVLCRVAQSRPTLYEPMDCSPPGSSLHGDSPDKNTGMGCHALLQGIFPTWGSNPDLPHYRLILYHLSHQGSSKILERVAYPFSRGTSQPRNWTRVSCISGRFFTSWATREILLILLLQ